MQNSKLFNQPCVIPLTGKFLIPEAAKFSMSGTRTSTTEYGLACITDDKIILAGLQKPPRHEFLISGVFTDQPNSDSYKINTKEGQTFIMKLDRNNPANVFSHLAILEDETGMSGTLLTLHKSMFAELMI